ncbi:hypothetical protein V6N11_076844 [Hibiscus sabdariffa]|uniref:Uncharacterized protein n=1 Tax=Hibiscus sabdariffa TaxID=183260 RepID=A0ABR2TBN5_9ROSI
MPDVSNVAPGCSNESSTDRPISPGVSMAQSFRVMQANSHIISTSTLVPCQLAADDSCVVAGSRTILETGSDHNATSSEPHGELEPVSEVTLELNNSADSAEMYMMRF